MDNRLFLALICQGVFVLAIGGIKSLVHGRITWVRFYLGLEIALVALGNGVTNIVDTLREWDVYAGSPAQEAIKDGRIVNTVGFIVVAMAALLAIMLIHQTWEQTEKEGPRPELRWKRGFWMGFISNGIAVGMLGTFVYFRLRGQL
jgi:hypothetical protein